MIIIDRFRKIFASFVTSRGITRHFRRFLLLDNIKKSNVIHDTALHNFFLSMSKQTVSELVDELDSHPEGLTTDQVHAKQEQFGLNQIDSERQTSPILHIWQCYRNPFNLLLSILAVISYITRDYNSSSIITVMVFLSTMLRFFQESRSNRAADRLQEMVSNTATVLRRDTPYNSSSTSSSPQTALHRSSDLPIHELVPGDIIRLTAGDMIPADVRVLQAKDLFINQSAMTGESMPIEKFAISRSNNPETFLDLDNICFMGTNVVSGSAIAIILTTGKNTYFGTLAQRASVPYTDVGSVFQKNINKISWLLILFMLVMVPCIFAINFFTKGSLVESIFFALSIAVGLTPEMLPMISTATLAKGAVALSKKKVIVKRLDAIQNFGSMTILCTDKTGTLTQDKIVLECYTDVFGHPSDRVLEHAYLNSYYQTGLKNLLDIAVLEHAELQRELNLAANFRKVDEIPFDFHRRRMSVVVNEQEDHHLLICKGAVEEIVTICTSIYYNDQKVELTNEALDTIYNVTSGLNEQGLRVVGVAVKELPPDRETYSVGDESEMTLVGYVAFLDPPKESTAPAIKALLEHGVSIKILTGDNELVTRKICHEVDLPITGIALGQDIDKASNDELKEIVEKCNIFAKLSPTHKEKIICQLRELGHVIGYVGDGINDAAALRAADVGISVDSAVDISKEAADVILLEKSLMVLEEGVIQGRKTFANMTKYIRMTISGNFGNVLSIVIASIFLPFLPLLPLQILTQNLIYDLSQTVIPLDNVDRETIESPCLWNFNNLTSFMLFFGPLSSVFDVITFLIMWYVFGARTTGDQSLFQAGWFVESLISQTLVVHIIRTGKIPFLESVASWPVIVTSLVTTVIGIVIPQISIGSYFKFSPLPWLYYPFLVIIIFGYVLFTHIVKYLYLKRYKIWH
ncbi:magnesium-translocating P-type ATPase [Candidatus Ichthyocystis hellenicum]|uniref:magnesium-translocating P-type ATPase n=1 Tax=Candidatus Ichthyocystis hellenicum TaxID=1561003 RepID=UPI001F5FC0C6|nr:magnesium-translocating P-type ATPase [Candidatus Ichthyocystis hellenicum]